MNDSISLQYSADVLADSEVVQFEAPALGRLTKMQGIALMTRLVEDDAFRTRFEQAPGAAMAEIGVPAVQIATLRAGCLMPRRLAAVETLDLARQRLLAEIDESVLSLHPPVLTFGC